MPVDPRQRAASVRRPGETPTHRAMLRVVRDDPDGASFPPVAEEAAPGWVPDLRSPSSWSARLARRRAGRAELTLSHADQFPEAECVVEWPNEESTGNAIADATADDAPGWEGPADAASASDLLADDASRPRALAGLASRGPWGSLAERWVPESLRTARVSPGRRGALVLAAIAAMAAVAAAVGVWWHRPSPVPVPQAASIEWDGSGTEGLDSGADGPSIAMSAAVQAGAVGAGGGDDDQHGGPGPDDGLAGDVSSSEPQSVGPILVSVTGRVRHPGVVTVPADARVADAIAAAGGALEAADLTGMNLAAHLRDGTSIVVIGADRNTISVDGPENETSTPSSNGGGTGGSPLVNLNTADATALEQLPGVGPVTAAAIIAWRDEHGPFTAVDQLQAVSGIGPATVARLAPHVTV